MSSPNRGAACRPIQCRGSATASSTSSSGNKKEPSRSHNTRVLVLVVSRFVQSLPMYSDRGGGWGGGGRGGGRGVPEVCRNFASVSRVFGFIGPSGFAELPRLFFDRTWRPVGSWVLLWQPVPVLAPRRRRRRRSCIQWRERGFACWIRRIRSGPTSFVWLTR